MSKINFKPLKSKFIFELTFQKSIFKYSNLNL